MDKMRDTSRLSGGTGQAWILYASSLLFFSSATGLFLWKVTGWHCLELQGGFLDSSRNRDNHHQYHTKCTNVKTSPGTNHKTCNIKNAGSGISRRQIWIYLLGEFLKASHFNPLPLSDLIYKIGITPISQVGYKDEMKHLAQFGTQVLNLHFYSWYYFMLAHPSQLNDKLPGSRTYPQRADCWAAKGHGHPRERVGSLVGADPLEWMPLSCSFQP